MTQGTAPTLSVGYDPATNHQVGMAYDGNGNVAAGSYDVENRLVGQTAERAGDELHVRPEGEAGGEDERERREQEVYFYGIGGQKLLTVACGYDYATDGTWICSGKPNVSA